MTETLVVIVLGLLVVAAATVVGPRLGIAAPLLLVAVGVAASLLPVVGEVRIDPEVVLEGVLPPLLYSSAVSMPAMNFRREFGAISGLSIVLVLLSALLLGWFFTLVVPGLSYGWGVALGAVVSPTDAVATSIIKQTSVSSRVVAMLDGESLLNDATALVLLSTAAMASFSLWGAVGSFVFSVVVAVVVGLAVGWLNLAVRRRLTDPTVNTVISFTAPFLAFVPVELLGGSGLVAAVVAGLLTGIRAPRELSPQNRLSDSQNWRTVELVLESAVFLTMGLQITSIVGDVQREHAGVGTAVLVAAGALALVLVVRAAYIAPLLVFLHARSRGAERMQDRLHGMQDRLSQGREETLVEFNERRRRKLSERDLDRFARRVTRGLADIDYFLREPLGWREGTTVVWAGMRGAVTVAAAQTLPPETPQRSVLVLVAFAVATMSLLVQGGTIGPLVRLIAPDVDDGTVEEETDAERTRMLELMKSSGEAVADPPPHDDIPRREQFEQARKHRLAVIAAQRTALLDARAAGTFDADVLAYGLANLDAAQIALELRSGPS